MSVYVVQERKKFNTITRELEPVVDITAAAEYGDMVELFTTKQHALLPGPIVTSLKNTLRNFSDDDYLLPIGNPVLIGIATAMAARQNMGRVKILYWDRDLGRYIVLNYQL